MGGGKAVRFSAPLPFAQMQNYVHFYPAGPAGPSAKLALVIRIALDEKFEEVFYFS